MIRAGFEMLVYADGTEYVPPVIHSSVNGWWYKPDSLRTPQEIKSGKNKTFARRDGAYLGQQHVINDVRAHFESRGLTTFEYEPPTKIVASSRPSPYHSGDTISVDWEDPVWGMVGLELRFLRPYSRRNNDTDVRTTLTTSAIATWVLKGRVNESDIAQSGVELTHQATMGNEALKEYVDKWVTDPFNTTMWRLGYKSNPGSSHAATRTFEVPDIKNLDFTDNVELDNGARVGSTGNGSFHTQGTIDNILQSQFKWKELVKLMEALTFVGYEISPETTYQGTNWNERRISGLRIDIPQNEETHEHSVHINAMSPHITVECGYEQDDKKWIDRKQREAEQQMREMQEYLEETNSYEIEL